MIERALVKIRNIVSRSRVDRAGSKPQCVSSNGTIYPEIENMEPQGLHFRPPAGAQGVVLAPDGQTSAAVAVCHSGDSPGAALAPGEGGLHYLGTFKVFLSADGKLSLGEKGALDAVSLASKVDAYFAKIDTVLRGWVVVPADGGAALKAAYIAAQPAPPTTVASAEVKCK